MNKLLIACAVLLSACETIPTNQLSNLDICESYLMERMTETKRREVNVEIQNRNLDCIGMRSAVYERIQVRQAESAERQRKIQASQQILNTYFPQPQQQPKPLINNTICDTRHIGGGQYRTQCH